MRTSKKIIDRRAGSEVFKKCTMCGKTWPTKDDFLGDDEIRLNGYQWNKKRLRAGENLAGLLIFTHAKEECFTTLGIEARKFKVSSRVDQ
jgi:hypothetical protein